MATAGIWGLHRDEFYYLAGGRRLDWGYVDHPPITPLLYRIAETLFGASQIGLRTMPALLSGALVVVSALIARELRGDRRAQIIAAVGVAVSPFFLGTAHFLSTVSVDILMWSVGLLLFARLLRTRDVRLWAAIGVVAGVGLMNKDTMLFWGVGVVAGLLLARDSDVLRTRWFLFGLVIALVIFLPNIVWQVQHEWPTIEFLRSLQSHNDSISNPWLYFPYQLVLLGPLLAVIWIPGAWWLLRADDARPFRALAYGYLVVLVLIFVLRGKAYYVGSWYPVLFAAGSVRLTRVGHRPLRVYIGYLLLSGLTAAPFAVPVVPSTSSFAKTAAGADDELGEMIGWDTMAQQVADIAHALPSNEQANVTILASSYSEAGAIEYWRHDLQLPQPISGHNSYWIWGYDPAHENGTTIAIGYSSTELARYFTDVRQVGAVSNAIDLHNKEYGAAIFVCRGQRMPWARIWPSLKHYS
ncbi:MAG TPA: glycosyltransferase family 39 protein [Acidimicrobiales bacterium]|nr:glycosyltransferase family 39 protein [Acidimicrobiales bacterium]